MIQALKLTEFRMAGLFLWLSLTGGGLQWRWTHANGSEEGLSHDSSYSNWGANEPNEAGKNFMKQKRES